MTGVSLTLLYMKCTNYKPPTQLCGIVWGGVQEVGIACGTSREPQ